MPTEKSVVEGMKRELRAPHRQPVWWLKYHGHGSGKVGVPDFLILYRGYFIAVEAKNEKGEPTRNQERELTAIAMAGGLRFIARSRKELAEILDFVEGLPLRETPPAPVTEDLRAWE